MESVTEQICRGPTVSAASHQRAHHRCVPGGATRNCGNNAGNIRCVAHRPDRAKKPSRTEDLDTIKGSVTLAAVAGASCESCGDSRIAEVLELPPGYFPERREAAVLDRVKQTRSVAIPERSGRRCSGSCPTAKFG
jgi:hypothetical protein